MVVPFRGRMVGPLEPFASGFGAELTRLGYTSQAACKQVELAAHLSRWLAVQGLNTLALTPSVVDRYVVSRRTAGYRTMRSGKALQPLLSYLRALGAAPMPGATELTPVEELLERYRRYLLVERGLVARAARGYVDLVRPFVTDRVDAGGPATVTATDVTVFLVAQSRRLAPKTVQRLATALRSLLRFWHLDGVLDGSLMAVVPKVAHRPSGLPRGLLPAQVDALLASCDRSTVAGVRDYAMVTLMAVSACAAARSPVCSSTTSTGAAVRFWCGVSETGPTGCRCPSMSGSVWWPTCTFGPLMRWTVACSSGCTPRTRD